MIVCEAIRETGTNGLVYTLLLVLQYSHNKPPRRIAAGMIGWLALRANGRSLVPRGPPLSLTTMVDVLFACSNAIGLFFFTIIFFFFSENFPKKKSETIFSLLLCLWVFSYSCVWCVRASLRRAKAKVRREQKEKDYIRPTSESIRE